jgi:hypothetical protein
MKTKKILKVSDPTLGTGGLNKILTVSVLYMGFSVRLHESKEKNLKSQCSYCGHGWLKKNLKSQCSVHGL